MGLSDPAAVSSTVAGSRWKVLLLLGRIRRQQIHQARASPSSIAKRKASPQEKQSTAAAVNKLAQQFLLQWGKVSSFHRAQDDALVGEEIFRAHRKAILQVLWDR